MLHLAPYALSQSHTPPGNYYSDLYHYGLALPFIEFHINGIIWYALLWAGFLSLNAKS